MRDGRARIAVWSCVVCAASSGAAAPAAREGGGVAGGAAPGVVGVSSWGAPVSSAYVTVGGYGCPGAVDAFVSYPSDVSEGATYPLISFEHGMDAYPEEYDVLTATVAGAGYIVVGPRAGVDGWCEVAYEDQARVVAVAADASQWNASDAWLWKAVDWSHGAGALGHSMGGLATVMNAGDRALFRAAVAIAPFWDGASDPAPFTAVPILYVGGAEDTTVPPASVETFYGMTDRFVDKAAIILKGLTHDDVSDDPSMDAYIGGFFDCYLKSSASRWGGCEAIYGGGGAYYGPLCSNYYLPHDFCEVSAVDRGNATNATGAAARR